MGFKFGKKAGDFAARPVKKDGIVTTIKKRIENFSSLFGEGKKSKQALQMATVSLVVAAFTLMYLFISIPRHNELTRSLGELRLLSQTLARQASEATATGSRVSINNLSKSKANFEDNLQTVHRLYGASGEDIQQVDRLWKETSTKIDTILLQQNTVDSLHATSMAINEVLPKIQDKYKALAEKLAAQGAPAAQIAIAKHQAQLAERLQTSLEAMQSGNRAKDVANSFNADLQTLGSHLDAQLNGSAELKVEQLADAESQAVLTDIKKSYDNIAQAGVGKVLSNSPKLAKVRDASAEIFTQSDVLLNALNKVATKADSNANVLIAAFLLLALFALFVVAALRLLALRSATDKQRVSHLQDEYDRNQEAILRLLDEIADLADGDLRSYATVSEDFTGAIADSINFAIDQLRDLVSRINETSQEISRYTQDTQLITNQLAEASEHQAQEIAGASAAINEMAVSIDQVSTNATQSAQVADRSVGIATNGANVVNRSIEGMDTIREQIQETSKRIKRLGESSQEIGNIVSLINDIADQTNILALNAAIQASMAGEAGRGFAVVADEVQRLAERSASATKQIETLVKTIQTDTNEAVISMEQTTAEVVRGATLAKDAGVALDEIQNVSGELAKLIQSISDAAQLQAASAGHISMTMNVVQEITSQTTSATFDTARSVSELAHMAEELRESVTDFKLPE